ncbi:methyltransferase domain-containing protein [bacterium]|nr:methyltransferase domain-containing protein [bacterium]
MGSGERQASFWGPSARLWREKHEAYSLPLAEWVLERVLNGHAVHLLDAGCGSGGALELAAQRGARVTGTDVAREMLELCKERVPQGEFVVADSENLPFGDNTFDAVIAVNSLQFTETPENALREFARVAKPGAKTGVVCFGAAEHSEFATVGAAVRKLFKDPPQVEGPFSLSPPEKLYEVIARAGLRVVESDDIDLTREFESFDVFWGTQAGTGATRYSVSVLGEELVRETMRQASAPFIGADGAVRFRNRFHVVIVQ